MGTHLAVESGCRHMHGGKHPDEQQNLGSAAHICSCSGQSWWYTHMWLQRCMASGTWILRQKPAGFQGVHSCAGFWFSQPQKLWGTCRRLLGSAIMNTAGSSVVKIVGVHRVPQELLRFSAVKMSGLLYGAGQRGPWSFLPCG